MSMEAAGGKENDPLRLICFIYNETDGRQTGVAIQRVKEQLGFTSDQITQCKLYLTDKGLLAKGAVMEFCLNADGLDIAKKALSKPDQASTDYFPPLNDISKQ